MNPFDAPATSSNPFDAPTKASVNPFDAPTPQAGPDIAATVARNKAQEKLHGYERPAIQKVLDVIEVPFALEHAAIRGELPKAAGMAVQGQARELGDEYLPGSEGELNYEASPKNTGSLFPKATQNYARMRQQNPMLNFAGAMAEGQFDPANVLIPEGLRAAGAATKAAGKIPLNGGKALGDYVAPAARAVKGFFKEPTQQVFNRYRTLEESSIPNAVEFGTRLDANKQTGLKEAAAETDAVFGGLTLDEKLEVVHRFEGKAPARAQRLGVLHRPELHPDRDALVNERVKVLDSFEKPTTNALVKAGLLDEDRAKSRPNFFSRKSYRDVPVYELTPEEHDAREARRPIPGARAAFISKRFANESASYPTLYDALLHGEDLDPYFDPATAYQESTAARKVALLQLENLKRLERVPIGQQGESRPNIPGGPLMVRQPAQYFQEKAGKPPLYFGEGLAGRKEAHAVAQRMARARAEREVLAKRNMTAMPKRATNIGFLRSQIRAMQTQEKSLSKLQGSMVRSTARVQGAAPQVAEGAMNRMQRAIADQGGRVEGLQQAADTQDFLRNAMRSEFSSARKEAREMHAAYVAAKRLASTVYRSKLGTDVDRALHEIAAHRLDNPAGTNLTVHQDESGAAHVRGGQTTGTSSYSRAEIKRVRGALRKAGQKKATTEQAIHFLDEATNAIGEARSRVDEVVRNYKIRTRGMSDEGIGLELKERTKDLRDLASRMGKGLAKMPPVPGVVKAGIGSVSRGQERLGEKVAREAGNVQAGVARSTGATAKRIDAMAQKTRASLSNLMERYLDEKVNDAMRRALRGEVENLITRYSNVIFKSLEHEPLGADPGTYHPESGITGAPDQQGMMLHHDFAEYIREAKAMGAPQEEASNFLRFVAGLADFSRTSIITWPATHAIWNLGGAFLSEGGDASRLTSTLDVALPAQRAAEAGLKPGATWGDYADALGASPNMETREIGLTGHRAAALRTSPDIVGTGRMPGSMDLARGRTHLERAWSNTMGGLEKHALSYMQWNNNVVFQTFEHRYAAELLRKFIEDDHMLPGDATRRVRKALGDSQNLTSVERQMQLNRLFYFYPWMKTVVPHWAKQGLFNPRTWVPYVQAAQQERTQQGDTEGNPFAVDLWKTAEGDYFHVNPLPQRVLGAETQAAAAIPDFFGGREGRDRFGRPTQIRGEQALQADVAPMLDYVGGHLQTPLNVGRKLLYGGSRPWDQLADPSLPPNEQALQAAQEAGTELVGPIATAHRFADHPLEGALQFAGGLQGSIVKSQQNKDIDRPINRAFAGYIRAANQRNDSAKASILSHMRTLAQRRAELLAAGDKRQAAIIDQQYEALRKKLGVQ